MSILIKTLPPVVTVAQPGFWLVEPLEGDDGKVDALHLSPIFAWLIRPSIKVPVFDDGEGELCEPDVRPVASDGYLPPNYAIKWPDGRIDFPGNLTVSNEQEAIAEFNRLKELYGRLNP